MWGAGMRTLPALSCESYQDTLDRLGFWLAGRRSASVASVGLVLKIGVRAKSGQLLKLSANPA